MGRTRRHLGTLLCCRYSGVRSGHRPSSNDRRCTAPARPVGTRRPGPGAGRDREEEGERREWGGREASMFSPNRQCSSTWQEQGGDKETHQKRSGQQGTMLPRGRLAPAPPAAPSHPTPGHPRRHTYSGFPSKRVWGAAMQKRARTASLVPLLFAPSVTAPMTAQPQTPVGRMAVGHASAAELRARRERGEGESSLACTSVSPHTRPRGRAPTLRLQQMLHSLNWFFLCGFVNM